jgi:uncharacterized membrane protein (DUF4010 family)
VLVTAVLGGAANVHAVTLAVSTLAASATLEVHEAVLAVLVGFVSNMVVKLCLAAWVGGRRLFLAVAPPLLGMIAAGVLAYFFT